MYPCPYCLAPATLEAGCSGCHRPPDPEAAEVIRLDGAIRELAAEVDATRRAHTLAVERLDAARRERNRLAVLVRGRVLAAAVPPPAPVPPAPVTPAQPTPGSPAPREASTRTVQNVLFVLGALLLVSAAFVFTPAAWANFGVTGRAAVL